MTRRRLTLISLSAAAFLALAILGVIVARRRLVRHRVFRPPATGAPKQPGTIPPIAEWTDHFSTLDAKSLADLLGRIEAGQPEMYRRYDLGYLHARALLEGDHAAEALRKLAPYLEKGNRFRDLALYHKAEIEADRDEPAAASAARTELIFHYPNAFYRDEAIEDEIEDLASRGNPQPLIDFAAKIFPSVDARTRRDLDARIVESLSASGRKDDVLARGLALLRTGSADDAADRVARALDQPDLLARLTPEQLAALGETLQTHRHFDRAVAVLSMALPRLPAKHDDLQFAIGRAWFGNEKYAEAQAAYLAGANATRDPKARATFFFHASRAAQLRGDDAAAERFMTAAVAVPGRFSATTAALTQRIRTRLKRRQTAAATGDLALLRRIAPNDHAIVEGSLAYAVGMAAAGNRAASLGALNAIAPVLADKYDAAEIGYWRARVTPDPHAAVASYLAVLRSSVPTHFAYFARQRLRAPEFAVALDRELAARDAQAENLIRSKQFDAAREILTDRLLLSTKDRQRTLQRLTDVYRELPAYRAVLELAPAPFPRFPDVDPADRGALLMAMGLFDEAADGIPARYPLRPLSSALTQSVALNRGAASKQSIYAVEVLMRSVPEDYVPDLLPLTVRQLLYPRYFFDSIDADAKKYDADPRLVLSIMREESRFNPRAKSAAAARGLLQFIITTARDIGRDIGLVEMSPDDLYDPRLVIQLGAKYIGELSKRFGGDRYRTVAAYNAGPHQVELWSRLAPAAGDDYFLSSLNFDETKNYVRKVMNSYERYGEIYGETGPVGGMRVEP